MAKHGGNFRQGGVGVVCVVHEKCNFSEEEPGVEFKLLRFDFPLLTAKRQTKTLCVVEFQEEVVSNQ